MKRPHKAPPASPGAAVRHSLTEQSRAPVANTRPPGAQAQPQATRACARSTRPAKRNGAFAPAPSSQLGFYF